MPIPSIKRAFAFCPFIGIDSTILMHGDHIATEAEVNRWMRYPEVECELDRLTLEMCAHERGQGNRLEQWQLDAEIDSFKRTRSRAA